MSTFWTSCFYTLQRRFLVLEYHKRHFPGLYWLKKKKFGYERKDENERNGVKADNKKGDKRERVGTKKEKERGWE